MPKSFKQLVDAALGKPEGTVSPGAGPDDPAESDPPPADGAGTLTRESANGTQDVLIRGTGVDRGRVDMPVARHALGESDVAGGSVDVRETRVAEVVEREQSIESGGHLPLGKQVADTSGSDSISVPGNENRRISGEGLTALEFPGGEPLELVNDRIWQENILCATRALAALESGEGDPAFDESLPSIAWGIAGAKQFATVQSTDLKLAEPSSEGHGDEHVIAKPVFVIPSSPQEAALLRLGESHWGASNTLREVVDHERAASESKSSKTDSGSPAKKDDDESLNGRGPLGIVKRNEQEFAEWIASENGFLTQFARYDDESIEFEPYQLEFLSNTSDYRCVEKSRQVGYSWLFACEAIARSHLRGSHNSIFVSYNLADSKEKIAYAAQLHEELPLEFQKKKVIDSKLELGFRSNDANKRVSRIISHPSRAPRGKKGDIYLDELAHYANDEEVYKGSTALILRAKGQLTVCSSPLGRRGTFWEIARQEVRPYPTYWRQKIPWWLCSQFCLDINAAALEAPSMPTEDRVRKYGSPGIVAQFESMPLEDFQQEFEVIYVDESMSFFPYTLILPCTNDSLELAEDFTQVKPRGRLTAGFDVGRKKDLSELSLFDELDSGMKVCRGLWRYEKAKFETQENACRQLLDLLPVAKLYIDQNGLGMHLAENLANDYPQVVPFTFSGASKEMLANDFKILLQRQQIAIPNDRDLVSQIHSVRKRVTPAGRTTFETSDSSLKGHADRFWSCALACQKERVADAKPAQVRCTIIGG